MTTSHKIKLFSVITLFAISICTVFWMAQHPEKSGQTAQAKTNTSKQERFSIPKNSERIAGGLSPDLNHTDPYLLIDPPLKGWDAPTFNTKDAMGKAVSLSDYKGKNNVVLIFYQGSFCSVCGRQLSNLQKHLKDFKTHETEIIAISADDKKHAMQTLGERGLSFKVVPDPQKEIIKQYGVANISKNNIAWPSAFIIDKAGKVQLSYAKEDGHRLHASDLLKALSKFTGKPAPTFGYDD